MWYKIKKIYMWVNNQEKQVRPKKTWIYSYDFTTWSVADFSSQWWTVPSSCSITSNWLTANSSSWITVDATNFPWLNDALQTAKNISLEVLWNKWSSGTYRRWWLYIKGSQDWIVFYGDGRNATSWFIIQIGSTTVLYTSDNLSSWEHLQKLEVDLQNKIANWNLWWSKIGSWSFTDADITQIKASTGFTIPITSNSYIKSIKVIIE